MPQIVHSWFFIFIYFFLQPQEAKKMIAIPITARTVKPIVATTDISIAAPPYESS